MIDVHCHLLPGVDDGPRQLEESVEMCRLAAADGCTAMIATPHLRHQSWWNDDHDLLRARLEELRAAVGDSPRIYLGGEIAVHSESLEELEGLPAHGPLPLAGSRYLLLEFDHFGFGPDPLEVVHELVIDGWRPIMAHPERLPWLASDPGLMARLVESGAYLQVTARCLTGALGKPVQKVVAALLDNDLVDFVASDSHGPVRRPPGLGDARRHVAETWGEARARALFAENPEDVLHDRPLRSRHAPAAETLRAFPIASPS